MKILANTYDYRPKKGGIANFIHNLLITLHKKNASIRVLAPSMEKDEIFDRTVPYETARFVCPEQIKIPVISATLLYQLKKYEPDVVFNTIWNPSGIAALPVCAGTKTPSVSIVYAEEIMKGDLNLKKKLKAAAAPIATSILKQSKLVFSISRYTQDLLYERGIPRERSPIIHPGFASDYFFPETVPQDFSQRFIFPKEREKKKVLLTVARLDEYKGIDKTIRALNILRRKGHDFIYIIAGDGPDRKRLESIARQTDISHDIFFAGQPENHEMRNYYNLCDVFIMPSRFDRRHPHIEGFGIVFLEANACGKPVIAGNVGGQKDAVEDDKSGFLVDPEDPEAIAEKTAFLLQNGSLAREMGAYGRKRAIENFTWDRAAGRFLEELEKIL